MNFLSHAIPYLHDAPLVIGTAVPDLLSVYDRRVRARGRLAALYIDDRSLELRAIAAGVLRHHEDDRWFHSSQAFMETNLLLAVQLRDLLPGDAGFRPSFVGHILIEMLLDAFWIRDDHSIAGRYYDAIASVPPETVERCVATITGKGTRGFGAVIERFITSRFLYDYLDHDKLLMRLNQIMCRVGLAELPVQVRRWLPQAEATVGAERFRLLCPPEASSTFPLSPPRR